MADKVVLEREKANLPFIFFGGRMKLPSSFRERLEFNWNLGRLIPRAKGTESGTLVEVFVSLMHKSVGHLKSLRNL